jgi:hypothetical protein
MANVFNSVQNTLSGGLNNASQSDLQTAVTSLTGTVNPNLQSLIPQLQLQIVQGTMTPAQAQAAIQKQSELNGIQLDPKTAQAQLTALSQIQQVASNGGLTAADKSQLNDIQQQLATQNSGQQKAIMSEAQQQGIGGSGTDLAARLSGAQTNATIAGNQGMTVAGNASNRALTAMSGAGALGQSIQGQQYGQAANTASAQNTINAFNAQNQQGANTQNTANTQAANATNFGTANTVAGTNTGIKNTQAMMPLSTAQQTFTNALDTNKAISGAANTAGSTMQDQAQFQQKATGAGLSSLADLAGTAYDAYQAYSTGGDIRGPGTETSDSVPIAASEGEFIVNAKSADQYRPVLHAINQGAAPEDISAMMDALTDGKYKMASRGPAATQKPVAPNGDEARKAALKTLSRN